MTDTKQTKPKSAADAGMRFWLIVGWVVIILIFGVGGSWAVFTRISGAVIAPGQISPESGVRTIQHPDGGVVKEIRIREGSAVRKGQVLMVLEDENLRAELEITRNRLDNVQVEIARLEAERDNKEDITFPDELLQRARHDERIAELIRMQRSFFKSRRKAIKGQQRVIEKSIASQKKVIAGLKARLRAVEKQSALIAEEVETVSRLLKRGQAIRPRLLALQREAARLEGERGAILEEIARRRNEISRLSQELEQLDRNFQTQVLGDLVKRKEEAESLKEKLLALEKKLSRIEIRAPVSGHVFNMAIRTIGGVITPGQPIMQIVPDGEPLVIEAQIRPIDIDQVYPGQEARIYFSALGSRSAPKLPGQVRMVSPAPLAGENWQPSYYKAEIVVASEQLKKLGKTYRLVPGMPVEVFITTRARRPFDILFTDVIFPRVRRIFRSD